MAHMYSDIIDKLNCPDCRKSRLDLTIDLKDKGEDIKKGLIVCANCRSRFPIYDYILEFLPRGLSYQNNNLKPILKVKEDLLQKKQQEHFDWYANNKFQDYEKYSKTSFWQSVDLEVIGHWRSQIKKDSFLLDVGCAQGRSAFQFADLKIKIAAFDVSREMVRLAAKKYKKSKYQARMSFFVADASTFPIKNDSFDCVLLYGVLHHLADPALACREIYRVLKKQGLYLGLENNGTIFRIVFEFMQKYIPIWYEEAGAMPIMTKKNFLEWFTGLKIKLEMSTLVFILPHLVNLLPVNLARQLIKATNMLGFALPYIKDNGGLIAIRGIKS